MAAVFFRAAFGTELRAAVHGDRWMLAGKTAFAFFTRQE